MLPKTNQLKLEKGIPMTNASKEDISNFVKNIFGEASDDSDIIRSKIGVILKDLLEKMVVNHDEWFSLSDRWNLNIFFENKDMIGTLYPVFNGQTSTDHSLNLFKISPRN